MTCSDVQTIQAGNGSKTQFSFDFPYIFKSEIHVYFWNAVTKEYDEKLTTDSTYPWQITDANPTIVEFTGTAPPSPATPVDPGEPTVDNVKIRRITQVDDIRALFNPGSAIRSDDLNKNFEQLRYAIQESNCPGIPDDVDQYLKDYYWDRYDNTLYDGDTWVSDDTKIASTEAIDDRIDSKIDAAITTDIATDGTGITVTNDGDGTITLGLGSSSVDFDRIKAEDVITYAEQNAGSPTASDNNIFTASAAARRFDTLVQTSTPSGSDWETGKTWLQNDDDLTLSVWNGSTWAGVASGGTFTNQPKVVYVDASSGDDSNDGHRISRPKLTIKAAIQQINNDATYGDGSVVIVAAGVYQEAAPIQIQKKNVSIIGQALRSCIVHPTVATQGDQSTGNHALFELNSGSFIQNLTLTGMKAGSSGTNTVDSVLPAAQGWNFAFYSGATITKSPYIQNCTNFSDSEIDNSNLNANTPAGGLAGDTDSAATGGGMLVDGSVVATTSPLRSMVADSYTHVGLNGPGILVTNNGYAQCTSSYAFFNKYHIKALNGGQANLAASTTDFGDEALVADGKSTTAIFTSNVDGAASDGATTFNINEPTAGSGWFGDAQRPGSNMLVTVNSVTYPVLSATANTDSEGGAGWTVTISRPNSNNRSENLGLNGAVSDNAAVSFFLRSMIASSGHTMEYVGSGTDYRALPENGGVPDETKQITELNDGKIWTAITDHNGKFKIGGNQTDDPIFEVDQQLGFVTIPEGSIAFNLLSDLTPQLGGDLDVNGNNITSASNGNVVIDPDGTGDIVLDGRVGIGTTSPSTDLHVNGVTGLRVSNTGAEGGHISLSNNDGTTITSNLDVNAAGDFRLFTTGANQNVIIGQLANTGGEVLFHTNNAEAMRIDSSGNVGIGTNSPGTSIDILKSSPSIRLQDSDGTSQFGTIQQAGGGLYFDSRDNTTNGAHIFRTWNGTSNAERARINSNGVGIGVTNPSANLEIGRLGANWTGAAPSSGTALFLHNGNNGTTSPASIQLGAGSASNSRIYFGDESDADIGWIQYDHSTDSMDFRVSNSTRLAIDSSGNVGIGTDNPGASLDIKGSGLNPTINVNRADAATPGAVQLASGNNVNYLQSIGDKDFQIATNSVEKLRITSDGYVGIGTSSPSYNLDIRTTTGTDTTIQLYNSGTGSSDDTVIRKRIGGTTASNYIFFGDADSTSVGRIRYVHGNDSMQFNTAGSTRLTIASSGDVDITGEVSCSGLDVDGTYVANVTAVSALDIDCSAGNYFTKTINANSTFTFSNVPSSRAYSFTLELTHTSGTVTWPTSVEFPDDTAPTLTTGKTHLFMFITDDGGTRFRGAALVDYDN